MPMPTWSCRCDGTTHTLTQDDRCPACAGGGAFDHWSLTRHEAMARYQYVTGLKPIGPHRAFADQLLAKYRAPCPDCQGNGLLGGTPERWRPCPSCEATGGHWTRSPAQVARRIRLILRRFPDARANPIAGFLRHVLLHDLDAGEMVAVPEGGER